MFMKVEFGLLVLSVLFFQFLAAQQPSQVKKGMLQFEKTAHNYGEVNETDGAVKTVFKAKNIGKFPMVIKNVQPSCGCTSSYWTRDTINPGDEAIVEAYFNPSTFNGDFEKALFVYTDGIPFQHMLTISGKVRPRPKTVEDEYPSKHGSLLLKTSMLEAGFIYQDEIDTFFLNVYNSNAKPISIKGIAGRPEFVHVFIPSVNFAPSKESEVGFVVDAKKAGFYGEGFYNMQLVLDDQKTREIDLHLRFDIIERFPKLSEKQLKNAPKIQVLQDKVDFGKVLKGDSAIFYYQISNVGKEPLKIRRIQTGCGCIGNVVDKEILKKGETATIKVAYLTSGREGKEERAITVITNDPMKPMKKLFFSGEVVTNPNALKKFD